MILTTKAILMKMRSKWNQKGSNELLILWLSTELLISLMMEKNTTVKIGFLQNHVLKNIPNKPFENEKILYI